MISRPRNLVQKKSMRILSYMARSWCLFVFILVLICVSLTFILLWHIPTRNALLGDRLPGAWRTIETGRLLRMHHLSQPIDVGSCPKRCKKVHKPRVRRDDMFHRNVTFHDGLQYDPSLYKSHRWMFLPLLNREEKIDLLHTLDVMVEALNLAGLQYFLVDGTLLGVVRHRSIIPWDDDIDVGLNGSEWQQVKDVLCCVEGFTLRPRDFMHWKFFSSSAAMVRMSPEIRFPFVDLFFYEEDEHFLWSMTQYNIQNLVVKKSDIFPLTTASLDGQEYPVPRDSRLVVANQFRGLNTCRSPSMFHKYNYALHGSDVATVSCDSLADMYTFYTTLGPGDEER